VKAAAESNGNGTGSYDFDLFTIGAGSGGVRGSRFAASYGEVVLLEPLACAVKSFASKHVAITEDAPQKHVALG
jgi:hypothetical protein